MVMDELFVELKRVDSILVGLAGGRIQYVYATRRCTARFTCLKVSFALAFTDAFAPAEDKAERAMLAEKR